ncbi:peptide transporter (plasmid) [Mycobacterium sp. MS1601]|uniref:ParB/RepB/Spo0J family partition protein n=1 Tax=Mycobacterium sp. MS1601 TaxID=1936029 RepID=UPI0009790526|nr:ParB N-terminal domain-containing protein [Mycobacterium sp. MS1601]AQA07152.1 peptide transporter [Mycobacterium sp. MS1601]
MARGQRTNLADLAGAVGTHSPVDTVAKRDDASGRTVPLNDLTANPRNPRDDVGTLDDLASIADLQLQPVLAVTREAYGKLYPDDEIGTPYVVINGCRRLAAAHMYGRTDLMVIINDLVARDHITLISASIAENVDRQDFDVIEEAKAVETLVTACGSADAAATRLRKTKGWVSQRRALLKLAPELQQALRGGELAIREARSLARVPMVEQVARWTKTINRDEDTDGKPADTYRPPSRARVLASALADFHNKPEDLASALRTYLGADGVQRLRELLH